MRRMHGIQGAIRLFFVGFDSPRLHHKRVVRTREGHEAIIVLTALGFVLLAPLDCGK